MDILRDEAWALRLSSVLASYGVETTHTELLDTRSAVDEEIVWPVTPERVARSGDRSTSDERSQREDLGRAHRADSLAPLISRNLAIGQDEVMFPSCFYAQILCGLPDTHRSVSAQNSPRASISNCPRHIGNGESVGGGERFAWGRQEANDPQKDEQRFASRMMKHARELRAGKGHNEESSLVECCDGSVLAQAEMINAELLEMLAWAQNRNQRSRELRRQLEHSRFVRYVNDVGPQGAPRRASEGQQRDDIEITHP